MICVFAKVKSETVDEEAYDYAYVSDLVILSDQRSRGLGRALLNRAEAHARSEGAALLRINVLAQNEVAKTLYLKFGFAELVVSLQKAL